MWVKIENSETHRGTNYKAGSVIEVHDDLGNRMISAGKATRSSKPEENNDATAADNKVKDNNQKVINLDEMSEDELRVLAEKEGIEIRNDMDIETIHDLLKAELGE